MHGDIDMKVKCKTSDVLDTLKKNRVTHKTIVAEARKGYAEKAVEALKDRLKDLAKGKVVSLQFNLAIPTDNSKTYDTAIRMLEMHTDETITLSSREVEHFVLDQWDWKGSFLFANAQYSATAASMAVEDPDDE